jgi:hypothetical protein
MKERQRSGTWCAIAIGIAAILGFALIVRASYPGYLHPDNVFQLSQMGEGIYSDWQPPFIAALWIGLMKIFPGPVGILVFDNLLIWGALSAIAFAIRRWVGGWSLLVFTIPFMPGMLNFMGHANRDILFVAFALAAFACAFLVNTENIGKKKRAVLQMLVCVSSIAAFLVRTNAVFALIPLLLYTFSCHEWKRNLFVCLAIMAAMLAAQSGLHRFMRVYNDHPGDSIKTYHLLALSYFEGRNLFPGVWTEEESRLIVEACYSPIQWDTAARWREECGMIHENLWQQGVWGTDVMTKAWLRALVENPVGTYAAMATTFRQAMHSPNSPLILYPPPRWPRVEHWEVSPPFRMTTRAAHAYMQSKLNLNLGKPWVFAAVLAGGMALLLILRLAETPCGLFALALMGSGAVYLLTYFPFNVSAEYRYFYWSGFTAWLGALMAIMAWFGRVGAARSVLPRPMRLAVCVTVAAVVALVAMPFKLPMETRFVIVTPQGEGTLTVSRLRTTSRPLWMGKFEGIAATPLWRRNGDIWVTNGPNSLIAHFKTLRQTVQVVLRSGPDGGKARIEGGDKVTFVDTRADTPGEIIVDLPPQGTWTRRERQGSWHRPSAAVLCFVVLVILLYWLSGKIWFTVQQLHSPFPSRKDT